MSPNPRRGDTTTGAAILDRDAQALLLALQEAGYLEGVLDAEVLDRLTREVQGLARPEDVRRIAAQVLFERQFDADLIQLLEEEWKAVFS